jgi:hypothetical protein
MSPETPLFGRMTHNGKRINLGRAPTHVLMTRALEEMRKLRKSDEMIIQLEFGTSRLQDATTFDKMQVVVQQLAAQIITDVDVESPFSGITVGRVAEAMASESYANYSMLCEPDKRIGFADSIINDWRTRYSQEFPDCFPHFPKWIDS